MNPTVALTMARNDSVNILIAGKVGTGKSSLINSIIGSTSDVAKEGQSQTTQLDSHLAEVKVTTNDAYAKTKAIGVTFWDSPGIGNVFSNEEMLFTQLAKKYSETDLLLYCLDMRQRLSKDDVKGITRLTETLGSELWKNAVFVLTFANEVKPPPGSSVDRVKHFKDTLQSWQDVIARLLRERLSVPEEIIKHTTIVPTGYRQHPPPDRSDWLTPFWRQAFDRIQESARYLIHGVNISSLIVISPYGIRVSRCVIITAVSAAVMALFGLVAGGGVGAIIGLSLGGVIGVILSYIDQRYSALPAAMKKRC